MPLVVDEAEQQLQPSFQNEIGQDFDDSVLSALPEAKPRILLMGSSRSGKSSIQKVVFHKMSPNETLFLDPTPQLEKDGLCSTLLLPFFILGLLKPVHIAPHAPLALLLVPQSQFSFLTSSISRSLLGPDVSSSFLQFSIWDFPGQIDFMDPAFNAEDIFKSCGALVYVIDSQDEYYRAFPRLFDTLKTAYMYNNDISFEIFIHKVDGLGDDTKLDVTRDIHMRVNDEIRHAGLHKAAVSFYLTSIYDHSIFEAFSKVVQKLIRELPALENLLTSFNAISGVEKSFLFDVHTKIYIATDSLSVDMKSYELCSEIIDVVIDVSCIYGKGDDGVVAYDTQSGSIIHLTNGIILYFREMTKYLALVCLIRSEDFDKHGVIDFNIQAVRDSLHEIFEVRQKALASK